MGVEGYYPMGMKIRDAYLLKALNKLNKQSAIQHFDILIVSMKSTDECVSTSPDTSGCDSFGMQPPKIHTMTDVH